MAKNQDAIGSITNYSSSSTAMGNTLNQPRAHHKFSLVFHCLHKEGVYTKIRHKLCLQKNTIFILG